MRASRRNDQAGLPVPDDLGEPADFRCDHGFAAASDSITRTEVLVGLAGDDRERRLGHRPVQILPVELPQMPDGGARQPPSRGPSPAAATGTSGAAAAASINVPIPFSGLILPA